MNLGSMIFELLFLWTMDFVCSHLGWFGFVWSCMWTSCTLDIWKRLCDLSTLKIWKLWILWAFAFVWIDLNFVFTVDLNELSTSLGFWTCQDAAWTFNFDFGHVIYELEHENLGICVTFAAMSTFNLWPLDSEFRIWKMNFELWAFSFVLHCLECLDFGLNFSGHCLNFGTLFEAV